MVVLKEVHNMFWGLLVEEGKRYTQKVEVSFHVSMAALNQSGADNQPMGVYLISDKEEFLLCNLKGNNVMQQPLDLNFEVGETVTFFTRGKGKVYLTGYLVPDDDGLDFDDESSGAEEGDSSFFNDQAEESSEEEASPLASKKRKLPAIQNKAEKKAKVEKGQGDGPSMKKLELDDDEDDDDFDSEEEDDDLFESLLAEGSDDDDDDEDDEDMDTSLEKTPASKAKQNGQKQKGGVTPQSGQKKQKQKTPQSQNKSQKNTPQQKDNNDVKSPKTGMKKVLQDGLIMEEMKVGHGPAAASGKHIQVNYIGRLQKNNKVFDATKPGRAFKFNLGKNEVIKGWDLGMQGMKVGGKRRLVVPPKLGYGSQKMGPIPPNSTLIFEVELKAVK